jgi:hypothetical protein
MLKDLNLHSSNTGVIFESFLFIFQNIVWLGQALAKARPKAITKFALNPPTTQAFKALPGKACSGFSVCSLTIT